MYTKRYYQTVNAVVCAIVASYVRCRKVLKLFKNDLEKVVFMLTSQQWKVENTYLKRLNISLEISRLVKNMSNDESFCLNYVRTSTILELMRKFHWKVDFPDYLQTTINYGICIINNLAVVCIQTISLFYRCVFLVGRFFYAHELFAHLKSAFTLLKR